MIKKGDAKRPRIFASIALVVILFAVLSCNSDQNSSLGISAVDTMPSWSPDGTRIVFSSSRDGNGNIYIMNKDGSNQTRLTDNPADDGNPSWSPDGTRIAFQSNRDGNVEIYIMNADGSDQNRITNEPYMDSIPSWSPDGTRIIFQSIRDGDWEIYTVNTDGSDQKRLTNNPAHDRYPSWSPDGARIVFNSTRDENPDIYIMDADGSHQTRLTSTPESEERYPSWSPDRTKIAFESRMEGNLNIFVVDVDGSNKTRLTDNPAQDRYPSWSPDGQKITFVSNRDYDWEVYVMDADGFNQVNLTNNAPIDETFGSAPLPQSELDLEEIPYRIVFESFQETDGKENWEICMVNADGSGFINLTNTSEIDEMYPHASPDGRWICFVADEGKDLESKRRNVYFMNTDGTSRVKIAENAYQPCWSADGKHIAYLPGEYPRYDPNMRATKGLEIYDLEKKEVERHPNDEIIHLSRICWSPDGKWFVERGNTAYKADDKTEIRLSMPGCTPDISPDGRRIAWNGTDWNLNIGTLDFNSPQSSVTEHKVMVACEHDYWVYHADWSPDSNYLAFSYAPVNGNEVITQKAPGSNICICDLRSGKWTQITKDGKHNKEPDWIPVKIQ